MVSTFIGLLDIQSWWEIPCIAHFCSLFSSEFNLPDIDIEDFEAALLTDGTDDTVGLLPELIVQLLRGCDYMKKYKNDITTSSYQMFLRRFFRVKCRQHNIENFFDTDTDFQSLPVRNKLLILHSLCHFRLESDDVIQKFNNLEADSLRVEPLGYDSKNSGYWYFFGTRLYREDNNINDKDDTIWQVICFTEEDWQNLATKFKNSRNKKERALLDILVENFLPKLPHLFREKEKLRRRKLFQARNSARIRSIAEIKQKELNEQQQLIETIEQERQKFEALNKTSKRRRSQSTSTASGISTYASSIRPSINSSDFLYKREKFCLSPDLCGGSVSTPPPLLQNINQNQQLFPPTPSQSPIQQQQQNQKTTDYSDNNEEDEEEEYYEEEQQEKEKNNIFYNKSNNNLIDNQKELNQNIINCIIDDKKLNSTNNYQQDILLIKNSNNIIDNNSIQLLNNILPATTTTIINDNIKLISTTIEENNIDIIKKLNIYNYKNDDTISVSSIEQEDKENFIFYKRSNTSDTTTTEESGSSSSSSNSNSNLSDRDIISENKISTIIKTNNNNNKKQNNLKKKFISTVGENIMAPTTNMKLPGRQTNNSLSSLSGNIFLPPFEGNNKVIKSEIVNSTGGGSNSTNSGKTSSKKEKSTPTSLSTSSSGSMAGSSSNNNQEVGGGGTSTGNNKKKKSKSNEIAAVIIKKTSTLSSVALTTTTNNCFSLQQNQQTQNPFLSFTETDEVLQIGMHKVLVHVKNHRDAWPFMDPVEEDIAPRYYSIIRRPMDLLKMEDKLDNGEYKKFSEFRNDFKLIVNNCRLYNGQNNEYTEMVNNLQDAFDKATKKYFDHYSDEDDETNLGYLDTKLNVFREKQYNKSSTIAAATTTTLPQSDGENNDDDNDLISPTTNKIIQEQKVKDKYKETSGKHYYNKHNENLSNNDDDDDDVIVDNKMNDNIDVQNDFKTNKRKRKDKDKRRKKKLKLESSTNNFIDDDDNVDDNNEKYNRNDESDLDENIKIINENIKNRFNDNDEELNNEIIVKTKNKKSKKNIETNIQQQQIKKSSTSSSISKKISKKKIDTKTKETKISKNNEIINDDDNDDIITEKKNSSKKIKTKNSNKINKNSKIKTTTHNKYSDDSENDAIIMDQNEQNYDYNSDDNSFNINNKNKNTKRRSSINSSSILSSSQKIIENTKMKKIEKENHHIQSITKSKKDKRISGGNNNTSSSIKDNSKKLLINQEDNVAVPPPPHNNKKKKNSKNHKSQENIITEIIQTTTKSNSKRQNKNKNHEINCNKKFHNKNNESVNNDDDDNNKSIDDCGGGSNNISDSENDSLMSLSSSRSQSQIFKVDLHKKYAKSASLDDDDFIIKEKQDINSLYKKSSTTTTTKLNSSSKSLKNNNKNIKYNNDDDDDKHSIISNQSLINRNNTSSFNNNNNNDIPQKTSSIIQDQINKNTTSKKKSKTIKTKSNKSIKNINNNIKNEKKLNSNKTLLPVNVSISSSNSSLNNTKETDIHEKSSNSNNNNINNPELVETSSSHSLLFLDKYDLIKQRRSRNNNNNTASTPEEKWNQIVKEAAEKNKDKKNLITSNSGGKNGNNNTNITSSKDKNQKLKETIAKLKAKNEKSKERSVLIDEIFGVKPTQEIRDEKTIFEKLRETCLDTANNKTASNIIVKATNTNKRSNTESGKTKNIKSQKKSELKEINSKISKKKITKQNDKKSQQSRKQAGGGSGNQLTNSVTPAITTTTTIPATPAAATTTTKKKSQSSNKTNMEALELETEQTLKDINRWLEHTPRFSEFSSASNSPTRYNLLDDFDAVAAKLDPNDFRRPVSQAVAAAAAAAATANAPASGDTLIATVPSTKANINIPKLPETFEENSSSQLAVTNVSSIATTTTATSKSPSGDDTKLITDILPPSNIANKINIASSKEDISQSSSNATINSSSNQSSLSTIPSIVNAAFTGTTTVKTTKEPNVAQLLPHPPPPPPHVKSQLQKEAKRKTLKEKITGQGNTRRKDSVRTMDRFQPGKSKGNLLSNTNHSKCSGTSGNNNDEIFPLGSSVVLKLKEVKNSLVVKTDESAPKLSLGSVLDTEGFGLGQLHNFGDEISCGELKISDAITSGDENDDKKKIDNLTISSSSPSDCGSKDTMTLSDDNKPKCEDLKETQSLKNDSESETSKSEVKSETKSTTSATPNLSAWFKAFGAPKKTKKQEEEEAIAAAAKKNENAETINSGEITKSTTPLSSSTSTDNGNSNTFNTLKSPVQSTSENFSLPAPRQRKASTGSTISERSSFSQDPDSPRIGIDDRFGTYSGPYASPIGASPIMVSPKPDEIVKPTSPYPLNGAIKVGFYQDTITKSSPEKSCSPRELPSPAYPQYSQHIYTSTSPNVTTDMTTTSNTTPITTSPYGAGGSSNSSTNNNTGCYNPSVDPNKTPTGSSIIYSPTSPVTPATPNLYEQYKQPHSQESDYNSSMSPSTNPNSPYQQPQTSPYQHNPNSPYQQSSNQNSPYHQPNSPYQTQQGTQVQSQQQNVVPSSTSNNNTTNNNNNQSSMPITIHHSPGNGNSQSIVPQQQSIVPQQQQQTPQQNETVHGENTSYQQTSTNSPYQQQSLQSPYQKNQNSPYQQQPIPTAHQSVTVLPSQQQVTVLSSQQVTVLPSQQQIPVLPSQQQVTVLPSQQQSQLPMNFVQQQTLDGNQQQHQQRQQQKQISPAERQQYPTDTQSRYSNLLENPTTQYQHQIHQHQTSSSIRSPYEQQQQQTTNVDQWKSTQAAATIVQSQNSQAMNLQQQNPMNTMNLPMNNISGMGSVLDQQQQQQMHSMNQMQQQVAKSTTPMQYSNYPQYTAPLEKDNNMHKGQVYGSDLSNHMIHKQNPANILNPLHMQQQPLHQQHPPKRSHSNDTTVASSSASLMNLGYSEPNTSMSDPKIQKRSNEQQQVDKMFDTSNSNTSTLNKHQQMFDSFLGSMGKNLGFGKSLDISTSKAYEMFNKATAMGFHNKEFVTNPTNRMQSIKDISNETNNVGGSGNNNLQQNQLNMSNVVSQGKSIENNSSYQQHSHNQQQQQQVPSNLFNSNNNNNSGSAAVKHSSQQQQNHPSNYSQNLSSQQQQQQNTNEKSHLVIPNPRQDQMSNIGRSNMDLTNYKTSTFNNPSVNSSSLLDPLRNINHAMAMLDDNSMLGLQNPTSLGVGSGGYYDKSMPPAAHMFSKNLPQQIYQNPGHYGMVRDQQNPPPPGNYVPSSSSGVTNMSTAALQMEQQQQQPQIVETKPKRGKKKKNIVPPSNDLQNNQLQNSMLTNSQLQQQHLQQQQQQQQQQHQQHMSSHGSNSNNAQNMLNSNQSSVQAAAAAAAAHHQGFQLYAGLKNAAAVAAASTSSSTPVGGGIQTNSTDVSAISLKTASAAAAASMVSGSAFNFGPAATGLGIPTGIYDNSSYLDEFRGAPNPYYMPSSHRVTPDPTGGVGTISGSSGGIMDKSINSNNTNQSGGSGGGPSSTAAVAAAAVASPYHQFLSHQAATQRSSYSFINSPQLDPNSPLYTQYMRPTPEELRARMIHGLLPGAPTGYSQGGYRPPPTHLGIPKPYDMNRNAWF